MLAIRQFCCSNLETSLFNPSFSSNQTRLKPLKQIRQCGGQKPATGHLYQPLYCPFLPYSRTVQIRSLVSTLYLYSDNFIHTGWNHGLTRGTVVHQGSQRFAVPPVTVEVADGQLRDFVLDPAQKTLFGSELLGIFVFLVLPHGHGDRVVQDEGPYQSKNQLQVPVYDGFTVCMQKSTKNQVNARQIISFPSKH